MPARLSHAVSISELSNKARGTEKGREGGALIWLLSKQGLVVGKGDGIHVVARRRPGQGN